MGAKHAKTKRFDERHPQRGQAPCSVQKAEGTSLLSTSRIGATLGEHVPNRQAPTVLAESTWRSFRPLYFNLCLFGQASESYEHGTAASLMAPVVSLARKRTGYRYVHQGSMQSVWW